MTLPHPISRFTLREYYLRERDAPDKSEYYQGEIFAMAGGTARHSLIKTNVLGELYRQLKGKTCTPYDSDLRLAILSTGLRTYPDASVYCDPLVIDPDDPTAQTATNATAVFEVLSKSTEDYDRGFKAENYRQLESLLAYVVVSQDAPRIEIHERIDGAWRQREVDGLTAILQVPCIGVQLALADVYDRVKFSA